MDEIRQTFELFDSDHDGKVSTKEISVIMRSLGMLQELNSKVCAFGFILYQKRFYKIVYYGIRLL